MCIKNKALSFRFQFSGVYFNEVLIKSSVFYWIIVVFIWLNGLIRNWNLWITDGIICHGWTHWDIVHLVTVVWRIHVVPIRLICWIDNGRTIKSDYACPDSFSYFFKIKIWIEKITKILLLCIFLIQNTKITNPTLPNKMNTPTLG